LTTRYLSFLKLALAAFVFGALTVPTAIAQVDIRSFGARCDGSDDSVAVQAALNSVPSTGGTVVVSCSAGIGANGIVLSGKSNVTVTGSGSGAGFRALATTGRNIGGFGRVMFLIQNCTNCAIKDLTVDGRNVAENMIGIEYCNGTTLQNVSVSNIGYPSSAAIAAIGNRGNSYVGNSVRYAAKSGDNGVRGLWIGNGNHETEYNATIANNTVTDVGASGIVAHVINSTIRDNYVANAIGAGIKLVPTLGQGGQTTIEGNTVRNSSFHGIQLENADSPVIVQRNTLDANLMAGVYVSGGYFNNGRISGNTITNHREAAIYLYNGVGISIDNNQIAGNGHGLLLEAIGSNTMSNLQVSSNNFSGQRENGITMWGRGGVIQSVTIGSNAFSNQSQYGIFIEYASGTLTGVSASSNCFANNSSGTIFDNRAALTPVASSASCPSPSRRTRQLRPFRSRLPATARRSAEPSA
jgi:parallel beta-helix repeat protein